MSEPAQKKVSTLEITKKYFLIFLPLFIIFTSFCLLLYATEMDSAKDRFKDHELGSLDLYQNIIGNEFNFIISDLELFSKHHDLIDVINDEDIEESLDDIRIDFASLLLIKKFYDQVRYINEKGDETVRVDFKNNQVNLVTEDRLQNKKDRYYFTDTMKLSGEEIFVSPLDLNVEHGAIEQPIKPMIRFAAPVFNLQKEPKGIVILNVFGNEIIRLFDEAKKHDLGNKYLVNKNGYFLRGPTSESEWGFMFKDKKAETVEKHFPGIWPVISENKIGCTETSMGLFCFKKIYPLSNSKDNLISSSSGSPLPSGQSEEVVGPDEYHWFVLSYLPSNSILEYIGQTNQIFVIVYIVLLIPLILACWFLTRAYVFRRIAEEETLQYAKEMEKANEDLKNMQDQIVQTKKLASIGQLAAGIAHEINNPLSFVSSNIEYLEASIGKILNLCRTANKVFDKAEKKAADELLVDIELLKKSIDDVDIAFLSNDIKDLFNESKEGVERIRKIVADLKNFARKGDDVLDKFQVEEALESALGIANSQIKYKAELIKEFKPTPPVVCSKHRLVQVFVNLLINAAQAISEKGKITVKTYFKNRYVYVEVIDDGEGIDKDRQEHIFDAFYSTKAVGMGTGLGLSISHEIIKRYGGDIYVDSKKGEGTTFIIKLPLAEDN